MRTRRRAVMRSNGFVNGERGLRRKELGHVTDNKPDPAAFNSATILEKELADRSPNNDDTGSFNKTAQNCLPRKLLPRKPKIFMFSLVSKTTPVYQILSNLIVPKHLEVA